MDLVIRIPAGDNVSQAGSVTHIFRIPYGCECITVVNPAAEPPVVTALISSRPVSIQGSIQPVESLTKAADVTSNVPC
jgi:hypothetical protein